ncbi:MAG TPA: hypothetical protein VM103_01990 [Candidatus Paceibacterota bacterium]|nr:hypothetical protein [Candidatus Paceibacterota bacterium]
MSNLPSSTPIYTAKTSSFWPWLLLMWGVYAGIGMVAPIDAISSAKYGLSEMENYILRLSFQLPIFILWGSLFYGTFRFWQYTRSIAGSSEFSGFYAIGIGLSVLIVGLVFPSYVGLLNSYYPHNPAIQQLVSMVNLYGSIATSLIAFVAFLVGGKRLIVLVPERFSLSRASMTVGILVTLFTLVYTYSLFHNPNRLVATTPGVEHPAYYLPSDLWIVLGVVIPYVTVWAIGLFSVLHLQHFARFVEGSVYQRAFRAIGRGIASIVLLSVGLQLLSQAGALFVDISLTKILVIIYLLLAAIAIGYVFIAQGARELAKLETA